MKAGANLFTPVAVGPKRQIGTVVDYAYYMYSLVSQSLYLSYLSSIGKLFYVELNKNQSIASLCFIFSQEYFMLFHIYIS